MTIFLLCNPSPLSLKTRTAPRNRRPYEALISGSTSNQDTPYGSNKYCICKATAQSSTVQALHIATDSCDLEMIDGVTERVCRKDHKLVALPLHYHVPVWDHSHQS